MLDLSIHVDLFVIPLATSWRTLTQLGLLSDWSLLPLGGTVGPVEGAAGKAQAWDTGIQSHRKLCNIAGEISGPHTERLVSGPAIPPPALSKSPPLLESRYALGQDVSGSGTCPAVQSHSPGSATPGQCTRAVGRKSRCAGHPAGPAGWVSPPSRHWAWATLSCPQLPLPHS